ncbi:MAG: tetratricopeptide repeat protein [Porphyromonas sp.]|nr:tetratricopeptide repeat protein [Porphyromonas sp.]
MKNNIGKRLFVLLSLALSGTVVAQQVQPHAEVLSLAREAKHLGSHVGMLTLLPQKHIDSWQLPESGSNEELAYLDAMARGALQTPDAELKLLGFIEQHPHSSYLPFAMARLGECYYTQGLYESAVYWLERVDTGLLPEEMAMSVDYYHGYSLLRVGRDTAAVRVLRPLTFSSRFGEDAAFYLGYLLMKQGDYREGIPNLERVQSHRLYGAYATAYLAEANLSEGRYSDALYMARRQLESVSVDTPARSSLLRTAGLASASLGDAPSTTKYLSEYLSLVPDAGQLEHLMIGKALFDLGSYQEATSHLMHVADGGEQNFMSQLALYYAGLSQLSLRQTAQALNSFDRSAQIAIYPQLTEVATYNAALTSYSQMPDRIGDGSTRLVRFLLQYPSSEHRAQVIGHLQDVFIQEPNVQAALAELDKIQPLPAELRQTRERVRLRQANRALQSGQTSTASRQYDEIIRRGDDAVSVAEAYLWKGEAAYRNGDYDTAISSTLNYLSTRPRELELNPNAYFTLGYAYFNRAQYNEAERNLQQFLQVSRNASPDEKTDVYNRLGDIAVQRRAYTTAQQHFEQAERSGGKEADYAHFNMGMIRGLLQDYPGKVALLSSFATRYPSSPRLPEALYEQGRTLVLMGDNAGARRVFERFQRQYQHSEFAPKVGLQLALAYFNDNQLEQAARAYEQVARSYPNTSEAQSAIMNLKSISIQLNEVARFNQLVQEVGGDAVVTSSEMDSLTYLAAERLITEGTATEAIHAMDDYLSQYPNGGFVNQASYNKGLLYYKAGNYNESLRAIETLSRTATGRMAVEVLRLKANAHDKAGEPGRAAETYVQLSQHEEQQADRSNAIRLAIDRAKKSQSSDFILSLAADVARGIYSIDDRTRSEAYAVATEIYARSNRKQEAIAYAQRVLALPDAGYHTMATVVQALSLYDQGNYAEVQRQMTQLVNKGSSDAYWLARAFILLADTYSKQGDKETARAYLESVQSSYHRSDDGIKELVRRRLADL